MADVFISYSRENEAAVRGLAEAVTREGYSVWWDEALPPHLSYSDVIAGEIGKAKAVIVVWSETAIASQWVRAEADLARNQKKLVQTSLDGRMPPMPFNQLHFVSIGDWHGQADHPGWVRVKESLGALCRGEVPQPVSAFSISPPGPAPVPPPGNTSWLAPILVGGLLLVVAAGAGAFWVIGGDRVSPQAPKVSAPVAAPRIAQPVPPMARPTPAPQARVQPTRMPAASTPPTNLRRYCSGPGRATARCRQLRSRMTAPRR